MEQTCCSAAPPMAWHQPHAAECVHLHQHAFVQVWKDRRTRLNTHTHTHTRPRFCSFSLSLPLIFLIMIIIHTCNGLVGLIVRKLYLFCHTCFIHSHTSHTHIYYTNATTSALHPWIYNTHNLGDPTRHTLRVLVKFTHHLDLLEDNFSDFIPLLWLPRMNVYPTQSRVTTRAKHVRDRVQAG